MENKTNGMHPEPLTVLLVDDEADFLENLGKRLGLRGMNVLTAPGGQEALAVLEKNPADVVVLDVWMPGLNGIATLERMKKAHPNVQVILLTGHADLEASLEGMALGAFDYLTKPVKLDALLKKIRQASMQKPAKAARAEDEETYGVKMGKSLKAADRLASLGTLAAGVVHEINNPLATIAEAAGWMRSRVEKETGLSGDSQSMLLMALGKIESNVERAARISRGLLSFARMSETVDQQTDILDLAHEVVELVRKTASDAQAEVTVSCSDENPKLRTDPHQLRQVLLNLCTNALQAVEPGGKVEIEVTGTAEHLSVSVIDNGPGIAQENLERIFEPFFTTKPPEKGTGLGLSVSRSIANKLGGSLDVESEPGQGSKFTIRLPRLPLA